MTTRPADATNIESDGTYWKCEKNMWSHWNEHFQKWMPYVGKVDQNFLNGRMPLVGEV